MTLFLIVAAIIAYAGSILAFGRGPAHLNANILGSIINLIGTLAPVGLFLLVASQRYQASGSQSKGLLWAISGGLCIGVFTLAMTKLFASGENVSFVTPLVYGAAVFLASTISILIFKEKVALAQLLGLGFIICGIILISYATWQKGKSL